MADPEIEKKNPMKKRKIKKNAYSSKRWISGVRTYRYTTYVLQKRSGGLILVVLRSHLGRLSVVYEFLA